MKVRDGSLLKGRINSIGRIWLIPGVVCLFSLYYLVDIRSVLGSSSTTLVLPVILLILLLTPVVILDGVRAESASKSGENGKADPDTQGSQGHANSTRLVFGTGIGLVLYVWLLPVLGYLVATFCYMAGMLVFLGFRKPIVILLLASCVTLVTWLAFGSWLNIGLPTGILGFG